MILSNTELILNRHREMGRTPLTAQHLLIYAWEVKLHG